MWPKSIVHVTNMTTRTQTLDKGKKVNFPATLKPSNFQGAVFSSLKVWCVPCNFNNMRKLLWVPGTV